jgi:pyruvate dehydrogenase E2 component (dihydrolipoamide acetyltransferase)
MSVAMEYGVILKWLKKEGDKVKKGEPVVEIFGEKNEFELMAPADGVLLKILCEEDDEIPISEPIAVIGDAGDEVPDIKPRKLNEQKSQPSNVVQKPEEPAKSTRAAQTPETAPSILEGGRIKASPRAKMRAKEKGIDLRSLAGTGPGGRIVEEDVLNAEKQVAPIMTAEDDREISEVETLSPLRRTIARRMSGSWEHPHITMITEIDMTEAVELRKELNKQFEKTEGLRISFNDIILKAVADTLEKFPKFNARLQGNDLQIFEDINLGVAMATDDGLIVPVVKHANRKSISEITQITKDLGRRAKENVLEPHELTGSTFTVSNLGPFGVDLFIPVINPPETAILALGQIKKKPVVIGDMIAVRDMMMASCAVDHRVLDGAPAGQFLQVLKETLENPYMMKY